MNCSYGQMIDARNNHLPSVWVSEWVCERCAYVSMWMMQMIYNDHLKKSSQMRNNHYISVSECDIEGRVTVYNQY